MAPSTENNCTSFLEKRFQTFIPKELIECINGALILDSFTIPYVIIILLRMMYKICEVNCFMLTTNLITTQ